MHNKLTLIFMLVGLSLVSRGDLASAQDSGENSWSGQPVEDVVAPPEHDDKTPMTYVEPPEGTPRHAPQKEEPPRPTLSQEEEKPSSASGEKIFDWSKYKNQTEVPHPFAEKGLVRVAKDGTYYYKVNETQGHHASSLHIGTFEPTNLKNPDATMNRGATFRDNYDQSSNPAILYMFEWRLWKSPVGKFDLQAGSGAFVAQGHGHFVSDINAGLTPREIFTFLAFPNSFGGVYRMQLWDRQLVVPYGGGGISALTFTEFRDDSKGPKFGGALAAYFDVGAGFNMTYFDYMSRVQLNREYGISAIYLTLEYRQLVAITQRYDFTSPYANAGFLVEY